VSEDYIPRIAADRDLQRILNLKQHLRQFPLLPPDPANPRLSFTDVQSGIRLPAVHCAIADCSWSSSLPTGRHWEMEEALMSHLWQAHRAQEMREIFEHCIPAALAPGSELSRAEEGSEKQQKMLYKSLDVVAYYTQAICEREREHMPCIGPSVDRRVLARATLTTENNKVKSLICFACAQKFPYVHAWDLGDAVKDKNVVHLDGHPDNMMYDELGYPVWVDFGCSQTGITEPDKGGNYRIIGWPRDRVPELREK